MIRTLVVDDSPLIAAMIKETLSQDPEIEVIDIAKNGHEAFKLASQLKPDMITMDIHMPQSDGFEATKQIMAYCPTPILILSSSVFKEGMEKTFQAMACGALECLDKNFIQEESVKRELIDKVKMLSKVKVVRHPLELINKRVENARQVIAYGSTESEHHSFIVAMAASTGGPKALLAVLRELPKDFFCPIVLVQHISDGFAEGFAEWLSSEIFLQVKVGEDQEILKAGNVYVAPTGKHMTVTEKGQIRISDDKAVEGQKPSGTVLLNSVAQVYGSRSLGVVMTGMGADGAQGLAEIRHTGGYTLAESESSCVIYGMPRAAVELGIVDKVLSKEEMSAAILKWASEVKV